MYSISLSSDGSTLYFGGRFTAVDGVARTDVAAVNAQTGALLPWAPTMPAISTVFGVTATASGAVYLGGQFSVVDGTTRGNAAEVDSNGQAAPLGTHLQRSRPRHPALPRWHRSHRRRELRDC